MLSCLSNLTVNCLSRGEARPGLGSDLRKLQLPEKDDDKDDMLTSAVAWPMAASDNYDTWEYTVAAEDLCYSTELLFAALILVLFNRCPSGCAQPHQ